MEAGSCWLPSEFTVKLHFFTEEDVCCHRGDRRNTLMISGFAIASVPVLSFSSGHDFIFDSSLFHNDAPKVSSLSFHFVAFHFVVI